MREDEVGVPTEIFRSDVLSRQRQFHTMTLHACYISKLGYLDTCTGRINQSDQIIVVTFVPVDCEVNTVVYKSDFSSDIQLMLLLVSQSTIFYIFKKKSALLHIRERTPRVITLNDNK